MIQSIRQALAEGAELLQAAGIVEARMEAMSLLAHTLQVDRTSVITNLEDALGEESFHKFREFVARRARREPLQYIVGHQEFFGLDFEVTPDVLIPRPETELAVEAALDVMQTVATPFICDVGTGTGCIAVSLLHALDDARAIGVDVSPAALRVARRNAERHGVTNRLTLTESDLFAALDRRAEFSLIVSNPPYVKESEVQTLQPEVREHEPLPALVSGPDGLSHVRALLRAAPPFLQTRGYLVFEIGFGQRDAVEQFVDREIWRLIEVRKDLQDIPRTVVLQKK